MAAPPTTLTDDFEAFVREDPTVDRFTLFARCREEAPIFFSPSLDGWVLTRYEDVHHVLSTEEEFDTLETGAGATVYGRSILHMRGREHAKKSGIAARRLRSAKAAKEMDAFVERTARRLASSLRPAPEVVDLKVDYCMWIPLLVIGELMDVAEPERFRSWYATITAGSMSSMGHPERRERALQAVEELRSFLAPILAERRESPGDDILSDFCRATYEGEPIPDAEILAMSALLLTAGVETTERALASLFRHLFSHRGVWEELRDDPTLVESVAAEALRFMPPVHAVTRRALVDTEFHGTSVAAGDRLFVLLASANRDPEMFDDPEEFRADRFVDDAARQFTAASSILPFGAGRHHCTGSRLVRVEMRHGIAQLVEHVEWAEFEGGAPPPMAGFLLRSPEALPVRIHPRVQDRAGAVPTS